MKYRSPEIEAIATIAKDVLENMVESMNDNGKVAEMVEHLQRQLGGDFDGLFADRVASISRRNERAALGMVDMFVTCDHVDPRWRRVAAQVTARSNDGGQHWHVSIKGFGYSKDYATPEGAVRGLCLDNGCTHVRTTRIG